MESGVLLYALPAINFEIEFAEAKLKFLLSGDGFRCFSSFVPAVPPLLIYAISRLVSISTNFENIGTMRYSAAFLTVFAVGASAFVPATTNRASLSLSSTVDDKTEVREYFNTEGFNRWNKIYSESDDVNSVQLDIRTGHDQTIQKILNWIQADGDIGGKSVCDCGCGVGSLAIPLAQMGKLMHVHTKETLFFVYQLIHENSFESRRQNFCQ